jgi:hypothetical protein
MSKVRLDHWLSQKDATTTFEIVENMKFKLQFVKEAKSRN